MNLPSLLATWFVMCLLLAPSALASTEIADSRPDTSLLLAVGIAGAGLLTGGFAGPRDRM